VYVGLVPYIDRGYMFVETGVAERGLCAVLGEYDDTEAGCRVEQVGNGHVRDRKKVLVRGWE
jgi:hypothetical protein